MTANKSTAAGKPAITLDIASLLSLLRAATPLPWTVAETDPNDGQPETVIRGWGGRAGIAVTLDFGMNNPLMRDANSHLIVSAVNAVPALIACIREMERQAHKQPGKDKRDAERYRWLRDSDRLGDDDLDGHIVVGAASAESLLWTEQLDLAIDAAMSACKEGH